MGFVVHIFACVILIIGCKGVSISRRVQTAEQRIGSLESRTNVHADDILQIIDDFSKLNSTIVVQNQCTCNKDGQEEHSGSKEFDQDRPALTETYINNNNENQLLKAVQQEKLFVRSHVKHMSETFHKFQEDVMKKVEGEAIYMNETATNVAKQLIDVQQALYESLNTSIDTISSKQSDLETLVQEIKEDVEKQIEHAETDIQGLKSTVATSVYNITTSIEHDSSEQSEIKTWMKDIQEKVETHIKQHEKSMSDLFTTVNGIMHTKLEALARQIDVLNSNVKIIECEASWTKYPGSCYKFFDDMKYYKAAQQECGQHGAFLVDVEDQQEMDFVKSLVPDNIDFWIGLTDIDEEGTWKWDRTGAEAKYLNWRPGQPDSWGGGQDCVIGGLVKPYDQWDDIRCRNTFKFVCKK